MVNSLQCMQIRDSASHCANLHSMSWFYSRQWSLKHLEISPSYWRQEFSVYNIQPSTLQRWVLDVNLIYNYILVCTIIGFSVSERVFCCAYLKIFLRMKWLPNELWICFADAILVHERDWNQWRCIDSRDCDKSGNWFASD